MSNRSHIERWFQRPKIDNDLVNRLKHAHEEISKVEIEICYHVEVQSVVELEVKDKQKLCWVLNNDFFHDNNLSTRSHFDSKFDPTCHTLLEFGPRFNFQTPFSSNAISICKSINLGQISRLEQSYRYLIDVKIPDNDSVREQIYNWLHDRMTQCLYTVENLPKASFDETLQKIDNFEIIDIIGDPSGNALKELDKKLGLNLDESDVNYYLKLFRDVLKRNPTNVECFDLAQSNSEHSRHWFFNGILNIDGIQINESLFSMIKETQRFSNGNNTIKFSDNSSAILGFEVKNLKPKNFGTFSELVQKDVDACLTFTAETHNFPTGVAPFSGATTGTGGRIRDNQAVGRGGHCIAATAGYCVGNLLIPEYNLQWEEDMKYTKQFVKPLEILIQASNGASDYGNKFGEPVIGGFTRSFGLKCFENLERIEWVKPIMFSAGIGFMDGNQSDKLEPKEGMEIVKIGGPVYRIGVGGGAASSVQVQGDNTTELDFNAVQRGDPEMEQKLNRVVRACIELGIKNPIISIHDQGAGGNGNVLKELVDPVGGVVYASKFELGDPTINIFELWGAEYQENNALLIRSGDREMLKKVCEREQCPISFVGEVRRSGKMVLFHDESETGGAVFDMKLELVLGKMPRKKFEIQRISNVLVPLRIPATVTVMEALERVLRLVSVGSKRFLTNKVDRCVTGLIAQQQCVGPLHTPIADVSVVGVSYFSNLGIASAIGEQPIKCLVNNKHGARMTVIESLTNLVFAPITELRDIKCSGNWMWAAKLDGEGAKLYDTCKSMCECMAKLGIAIDGGKDSLSMAARVDDDIVKAPGSLVVSTYAPCTDITKITTPDFKAPSINKNGILLFVDLSGNRNRLGGSAVAQCYQQLGDNAPDVENVEIFKLAFQVTQELIRSDKVLAGHDVSDGGLVVCILEMCFGGMCGAKVEINHRFGRSLDILFCEEVGWILEVFDYDVEHCLGKFHSANVPCYNIGQSGSYGLDSFIDIEINQQNVLRNTVLSFLKYWEETSWQIERLQANTECVDEEYFGLDKATAPKYRLEFDPDELFVKQRDIIIKVAVIREEGSNGDREMAAALIKAGFNVWDVTMQDLLNGQVSLNDFKGVVFPGGFSYGDVLGSAKGWAASIKFNSEISEQFRNFYQRDDTFSLGVCNGCQLMALINWVGPDTNSDQVNIVLKKNKSNRFECRWSTVKIEKTNSIFFDGMEGSSFGIWIAHGEGQFSSNEPIPNNYVPLRYVDCDGEVTTTYPFNPNGSPDGIAAVISENGRHLAMMPHPERCVELYQWPWVPTMWRKTMKNSPWLRMFQNVYYWCVKAEI